MRNIKRYLVLLVTCIIMSTMVAHAEEQPVIPQMAVPKASQYVFRKSYNARQIGGRKRVINVAKKYLGIQEGSAAHEQLVKYYNSATKNTYINNKYGHIEATTQLDWCDIFVSAVFIRSKNMTSIGAECSCERHIQLLKKKKCWKENDAYKPSTGDLIFYDWDDSGVGECTGWSDHVGIVVAVIGGQIITIEGNYSDTVTVRSVPLNGQYIRGFGVPKYRK